jgi:DNA-binding HxlR family transcriptional regulator
LNAPFIVRALDVIGERWMIAILCQVFLGARWFNDIQRNLGIPRAVLSARLRTLAASDLIERRVRGCERRETIFLTERGRGLWIVLTAVMRWAEECVNPDDPPLVLIHQACGSDSRLRFTCQACGDPVEGPGSLVTAPGPGAIVHG